MALVSRRVIHSSLTVFENFGRFVTKRHECY